MGVEYILAACKRFSGEKNKNEYPLEVVGYRSGGRKLSNLRQITICLFYVIFGRCGFVARKS